MESWCLLGKGQAKGNSRHHLVGLKEREREEESAAEGTSGKERKARVSEMQS